MDQWRHQTWPNALDWSQWGSAYYAASSRGTIDWHHFLGSLSDTRSSRRLARDSVVFLRLRPVFWCVSCWIWSRRRFLVVYRQTLLAYFDRFRSMFPLETTIFDFYDLDFINFIKKVCAVRSLGVVVWSDLVLNFEGNVAGIELSAKTTVVWIEQWAQVRSPPYILHAKAPTCTCTCIADLWKLCHRCHSLSMDAQSSQVAQFGRLFLVLWKE